MSDISALSHEYRTASELAEKLNEAVIALKKARLEPAPPLEACTNHEGAQTWLADVIDGLVAMLGPVGSAASPKLDPAALRVPGALVARLRGDHLGDLAYFLEDLRALARHLREGCTYLTDSDIELLDRLAVLVDAETSSAFRRLMRK